MHKMYFDKNHDIYGCAPSDDNRTTDINATMNG